MAIISVTDVKYCPKCKEELDRVPASQDKACPKCRTIFEIKTGKTGLVESIKPKN